MDRRCRAWIGGGCHSVRVTREGLTLTTGKTGLPATVTQRGKEFMITVDGQTAGVATFEERGNRRAFVHTEVDDAFQGRGLATILVDEAIKSTKADGLPIVAVCPMFAAFLHKHKEFDDIVDPVTNETEMVSHSGERRVYLARHGRTALNADDRLRGLSDPPLDPVGIAEAAGLAQTLAAKHPTVGSRVPCSGQWPPRGRSARRPGQLQ
jgi:uncharacterized protein